MKNIIFEYNDQKSVNFSPLNIDGEKKIVNGDEIVIQENKVRIIFRYPLTHSYIKEIDANESNFTRSDLWRRISQEYQKIYREEYETSYIKPKPIHDRKIILNRETTYGKYGIWGHDLHELCLEEMKYIPELDCWELFISTSLK